jgi:hypothetical protein
MVDQQLAARAHTDVGHTHAGLEQDSAAAGCQECLVLVDHRLDHADRGFRRPVLAGRRPITDGSCPHSRMKPHAEAGKPLFLAISCA